MSILSSLILFVLAGCRDVAPISVEEPSTENRTITLNLDITTRVDNLQPDGSEPDIIRLWIFDENNNFVTSIVSSQNEWTNVENTEGDFKDIRTTLKTEIEAKGINQKSFFKIYLVLNQPYTENNVPVDFNITTINELKNKTFILTEYAGDNKVPMTGEGLAKFSKVEGNKMVFDAPIDVKRSVAKLGIYCTKASETSSLKINKITIGNMPEKGYLFEPYLYNQIEYTSSKEIYSGVISSFYTGKMNNNPDGFLDEEIEKQFTEIFLSYLLENLNGDDSFLQVNGSVPDDRYFITLNYLLNNEEYTQNIYVSKIERNQFSKIYIRINDVITLNDIYCQVNSWTKHEMVVPDFE